MTKLIAINVFGRRWFQRTYGNTYCAASITLMFADGSKRDLEVSKTYGYGDYYLQAAGNVIEREGFMPGREKYASGGSEPLSLYCSRNSILINYSCADVRRERDL